VSNAHTRAKNCQLHNMTRTNAMTLMELHPMTELHTDTSYHQTIYKLFCIDECIFYTTIFRNNNLHRKQLLHASQVVSETLDTQN